MTDEQPQDEGQTDPLSTIRAENQQIEHELTLQGVTLDPSLPARIKIDTLVDVLLGDGPVRHLFELQSAMHWNTLLQQARSEVTRAKLMEGVKTNELG